MVSTPEEHDKIMSVVQVAHHLLYLAYALTLWESLDPEQVGKYSTKSLEATLLTMKKLRRNLSVVKEIQKLNIYGIESKAKLLENLKLLAEMNIGAWSRLETALNDLFQSRFSKIEQYLCEKDH